MILLKWNKQFKYFENMLVTPQGIHKIPGELYLLLRTEIYFTGIIFILDKNIQYKKNYDVLFSNSPIKKMN